MILYLDYAHRQKNSTIYSSGMPRGPKRVKGSQGVGFRAYGNMLALTLLELRTLF